MSYKYNGIGLSFSDEEWIRYIEENYFSKRKTRYECISELGISLDYFKKQNRRLGLVKPREFYEEMRRKSAEKTCQEKYNCKNFGWSDISRKKREETNMKRYGGKNCMSDKKISEKVKEKLNSEENKNKFKEIYHSSILKQSKEKRSSFEDKLINYIRSINPKITIINNDKSTIKNPETGYPLELDIYLPDYNFAIEYNSNKWHIEEGRSDRDNLKKILCYEKGIDLLQVSEDDLKDYHKSERVKDYIRNTVLRYNSTKKIVSIKKIEKKDASYDVETESGTFNLSGILSHNCATMGCRTRVFEDIHGEKTSVGRGNLSFSTINIVKLGILAMKKHPSNQEERIKYFFELLDKYTDVCAEQLHKRFEFQCQARAYQFPLLMKGMWIDSEKLKPTDEVREVLKHGTLGVGFIGLAECLIALTGHHHGESEEAQELGLKIVGFINDKCQQYKEKYDLNYSCLATPAEGLSGKFTKKDKKEFGEIPGITDKDYYTNSNHVPVYYKIGIEDKIRIEAPYHKLTSGGHIAYIELDGDVTKNVSVVEKIVDLYDKYDIGYGSINFCRSRCLDCGFENTDKDLQECPKCGSENIDTIERIK